MHDSDPRVLYVRTEGRAAIPRAERRAIELAGDAPRRVLVEEALGFDLLGESDIRKLTGLWGWLLRRLPMFIALSMEVVRRRRDYDVVVSWAEKYSVAIAGALLLVPRRPRHLAIMDWVSKPVVRIPLRLVRSGIDRVLTWSSVQGDFAVKRIGFTSDQIQYIEHPVDHEYFAPIARSERAIIFSAGETQRDFRTLLEAVSSLGAPTVIAASLIGVFNGFRTRLRDASELVLPANVVVEAMTSEALRLAYSRARVVVVPVMQAENNAGISVLLEAMSMGRPVVITHTQGQVDVVRHGENGLYVPPGDPDALRDAVQVLLDDPDYAETLGRQGRADVLERHRVDVFTANVRDAARRLH